MNEIELLFQELSKYDKYPIKMKKILGEIKGIGFFPSAKGIFTPDNTISNKEIMVLGQDGEAELDFKQSINNGQENLNAPTWRNLINLLKESNNTLENCFFTSAIMGIRTGNKSSGKSPAFRYNNFITFCRNFFVKQLTLQKPKLIIVLGIDPLQVIFPLAKPLYKWERIKNFENLDKNKLQLLKNVTFEEIPNYKVNIVVITHPRERELNIKRRRFLTYQGNEAEVKLIQTALRN